MTKAARFWIRVLALAFGLVSFLLLDAVLMGFLPLLGAAALLPVCLLITGRLLTLSLSAPVRRAVRQGASPTPHGGRARPLRVRKKPHPTAPHRPHAA